MTTGVVAWASYIPYWRLRWDVIAAALDEPPTAGERAVASFDEDTTSMAVEAARPVVAAGFARPGVLTFGSSAPAYLDKNNATAVHAALALGPETPAFDVVGSVRAAVGSIASGQMWASAGAPALVVASDVRTGLPGGTDERFGGDGAAALLIGTDGVAAEIVARSHLTEEFLDRWRLPGADHSERWEDRFGEDVYVPMGEQVIGDALKTADIAAGELDHVAIAGPHLRATRRVLQTLDVRPEALAPDLVDRVGQLGAAHPLAQLCDVLDRAGPGEAILLLSLSDGADAFVFRTTDQVVSNRELLRHAGGASLAHQATGGRNDLGYARFLTWRQLLHREPPRRPDPDAPAAPPARRAASWKFAFIGSRCRLCTTLHVPPARICMHCRVADEMDPEHLRDREGTVATFTVDHLAHSPSPPVVAAVVDLDGGGRVACELTDLGADEVQIGIRVRLTFRRLFTSGGTHNYFWKMKPVRPPVTTNGDR